MENPNQPCRNTAETPTPAEYWDQLNRHDWFYSFSDDHTVWKAGQANFDRLQKLSYASDEHRALFTAFCDRTKAQIMGGDAPEKPTRPEEQS